MPRLYLYDRNKKAPEKGHSWSIGGYGPPHDQRQLLHPAVTRDVAQKILAAAQERLDATVAETGTTGPLTFAEWAGLWLVLLAANNPTHSGLAKQSDRAGPYEGILRNHVLPHLGRMVLASVTAADLEGLLRALRGTLPASRTRRKVWRLVVQIFRAAVKKEHIDKNPCYLVEPALVPGNVDVDPEWRELAVFTKEEAEALIFDDRVRADRRVYNALLYCLGTRQGETSALRVRVWTRAQEGDQALGRMLVAFSFNSVRRLVKRTKTGVTRMVPVHPVLEEALREWLAPGGGWAQMYGREPGPDDFIVPSTRTLTECRHKSAVLHAWHGDMRRLGLRKRRMHDTRATYIALLLDNEASETMVKHTTHGSRAGSSDAFEVYKRRPGWLRLCDQILKLPLTRPAPAAAVVPMRKYANLGASSLRDTYSVNNPEQSQVDTDASSSPSRTVPIGGPTRTASAISGHIGDSVANGRQTSRTPSENGPHLCFAVSAVSKALTALEKGDTKLAIAILRKVGK